MESVPPVVYISLKKKVIFNLIEDESFSDFPVSVFEDTRIAEKSNLMDHLQSRICRLVVHISCTID